MPRSVEDASFKLSENVYEFIGNYLIVALICVCCVLCAPAAAAPRPANPSARLLASGACARCRLLITRARRYKRPVALVGILITSKAWDWLRFQEGGADDVGSADAAGASPPTRGRRPADAADAPPPQRRTPSRISQLKQLAVTICACTACAARSPACSRARRPACADEAPWVCPIRAAQSPGRC